MRRDPHLGSLPLLTVSLPPLHDQRLVVTLPLFPSRHRVPVPSGWQHWAFSLRDSGSVSWPKVMLRGRHCQQCTSCPPLPPERPATPPQRPGERQLAQSRRAKEALSAGRSRWSGICDGLLGSLLREEGILSGLPSLVGVAASTTSVRFSSMIDACTTIAAPP